MSLVAASSAASRHLLRRVPSHANAASPSYLRIGGSGGGIGSCRPLSFPNGNGAEGSGLRRPRSSGRPSSAPKAPSPAAAKSQPPPPFQTTDPHAIANEMVSSASTEGRTPGTESVRTLTREQKMSNYAMATGLLGFVSYVFYYSLASVGGAKNAKAALFGEEATEEGEEGGAAPNPGFEEFMREAQEGRELEERQLKAEREARGEARELVELEDSAEARLRAEGVEDAIIAKSVTEEEEREMAREAGFVEGGEGRKKNKRPLWKRVVFFWRRE
ncbi:hypothetical protein ACHAWF_013601 [Thalassiosira exigua]